jgi:hypothetical protein
MTDIPIEPGNTGKWIFFDRLPRLTHRQDGPWRRQIARACEDLAADLAQGRWPEPTCTAEELVLHLAIKDAPGYLESAEENSGTRHFTLPEHRDDYDWRGCSDLLVQDGDVLMLYDARLDGIESSDEAINQHLGMGDLRPAAWFTPFANTTPRDPQRTHHR